MNKERQDLAWSVLPKEFKEAVKKMYNHNPGQKPMPENTSKGKSILRDIFGHDNLTSDAEGEEMLTVSRKQVQEIYTQNQNEIARENVSSSDKDCYETVNEVLKTLFGSKCLPDNVDSLDSNVDSLEPKPAEPKFKVSDIAVVRGFKHPLLKRDGAIVTILSYHEKGDFYSCAIAPNVGIDVGAEHLKPYSEPQENVNLSQETANCDKQFDNILKDSFSKERRLNIAAMMAQAILTRIDDTPQVIADVAFRYADALIVEVQKGGKQ